MPGRIPKPSSVLTLEKGKLYSDQRDRAELEPKATREMVPRCPKRFTKEERLVWKNIAAVLKNYGLFTAANAVELELLTTAWAQYVDCCQKMSEEKNIIIKGPLGQDMYNPYFNAQHKLGQLVDRYAQNLGLSSIALSRIGSFSLKARKEKGEFFD